MQKRYGRNSEICIATMPFHKQCIHAERRSRWSYKFTKGIGGTLYGVCCMHGWSKSGGKCVPGSNKPPPRAMEVEAKGTAAKQQQQPRRKRPFLPRSPSFQGQPSSFSSAPGKGRAGLRRQILISLLLLAVQHYLREWPRQCSLFQKEEGSFYGRTRIKKTKEGGREVESNESCSLRGSHGGFFPLPPFYIPLSCSSAEFAGDLPFAGHSRKAVKEKEEKVLRARRKLRFCVLRKGMERRRNSGGERESDYCTIARPIAPASGPIMCLERNGRHKRHSAVLFSQRSLFLFDILANVWTFLELDLVMKNV